MADIKYLESRSFKLNKNGKDFQVEFKLELLPNDMKMLAFLAGELTNPAYYFSTFVNVHKGNANVLDKCYNTGKSTDWVPFTYQKRLNDVRLVEQKKAELLKKNNSATTFRRNTTYIKSLKCRQEFVPLVDKYIDKAMAEPLHLKNNVYVYYEERDIVYKTKNRHSEDNRDIYCICDYPHLLKTGRNNSAHSGFDENFSRLLWNDNKYLTWSHVKDLMLEDLDCGLQLCPKITTEHIKLTPYSIMNVRLAAQVLSTSVSIALKSFGPPEATATAKYCEMFFDCFNVCNTKEYITKQKPFLKPYTFVDDERFQWLMETFLPYFTDWKNSIKSRPGGPFTNTEKSRMFISWQTHKSVIITHSSIDLIKYLLNHQVKYVLTERFCQDPLENYFGRQRSIGRRRDNPNLRTFGYQDNTIRTSRIFRPIAGNSRKDEQQDFEINCETLPSRTNKRKSEV